MYQFFVEEPLIVGNTISLDKNQAHHAINVLHLHHETVRLVSNGIGYFADGYTQGKEFLCHVTQEDEHTNELPYEVTLAMALIRREKMELVLQKATELGVTKIIPLRLSRCVVKEKEEKKDRQLERMRTIVKEASCQCKRNRIPEITVTYRLQDLEKCDAQNRFYAYEKAYGSSKFLSDYFSDASSLVVIGPEGGLSPEEVSYFEQHQYTPITLGSRILRAETAAIYSLSVLSEYLERGKR